VIPQLVTVRVKRPVGRTIRIWVPVLPIVLVLSPILILAAMVAAVACLVYRVRVTRAFGTGWRLFSALPGTRVDVHQGRTAVLVSIR
jgi:predicted membrane metal-binding protein